MPHLNDGAACPVRQHAFSTFCAQLCGNMLQLDFPLHSITFLIDFVILHSFLQGVLSLVACFVVCMPLQLVGNKPNLGSWAVDKGPPFTWTPGTCKPAKQPAGLMGCYAGRPKMLCVRLPKVQGTYGSARYHSLVTLKILSSR